jgi:hypothetical protein
MTEVKVTASSGSTNSIDLLGLDDIDVDLTLGLPQPLRTESTNALTVNPVRADLGTTSRLQIDPLTTDSRVSLDLKPAVVDLCLTLNVGKLPNVCIKQPYHHHVGFTLWGMEVWGYTFSGEQETLIQEQHPQPRFSFGPERSGWSAPAAARHHAPPIRETGGLRVTLGS